MPMSNVVNLQAPTLNFSVGTYQIMMHVENETENVLQIVFDSVKFKGMCH